MRLYDFLEVLGEGASKKKKVPSQIREVDGERYHRPAQVGGKFVVRPFEDVKKFAEEPEPEYENTPIDFSLFNYAGGGGVYQKSGMSGLSTTIKNGLRFGGSNRTSAQITGLDGGMMHSRIAKKLRSIFNGSFDGDSYSVNLEDGSIDWNALVEPITESLIRASKLQAKQYNWRDDPKLKTNPKMELDTRIDFGRRPMYAEYLAHLLVDHLRDTYTLPRNKGERRKTYLKRAIDLKNSYQGRESIEGEFKKIDLYSGDESEKVLKSVMDQEGESTLKGPEDVNAEIDIATSGADKLSSDEVFDTYEKMTREETIYAQDLANDKIEYEKFIRSMAVKYGVILGRSGRYEYDSEDFAAKLKAIEWND